MLRRSSFWLWWELLPIIFPHVALAKRTLTWHCAMSRRRQNLPMARYPISRVFVTRRRSMVSRFRRSRRSPDHGDVVDSLHFHAAYFFLNSALSSLPVDVCGRSLTKTKSSGICHLANFVPSKRRNSSAVAL